MGAVKRIGGADGPTSVFICGGRERNPIRWVKGKLRNWNYERKRKRAAGQIKAGAHTIEETVQYIRETYQAVEASVDYNLYEERRRNLRIAQIRRYQPSLLGEEIPVRPPRDLSDEQELLKWHKAVQEQTEEQERRAEEIPQEVFPVEYHLFFIDRGQEGRLEIETELLRGELSCSYGGRKESLEPILKDIYRYYGVSQEDIDQKTQRYRMLEMTLAM